MADIHPSDAQRLGIAQDDVVELYTALGSITVLANLRANVDKGCVYMYHGYSEADVNSLMDSRHLDPYSGFPGFRSMWAGLRKTGGDNTCAA
jgi:anaerobic selenocysteine-containing dehydrogenase